VFERHSSGMIGEEGSAYGRVWFYRDVTDRARYEQELREEREQVKAQARHIMEVAERLAVARRDAEHARRAAEEASRAKSQFLAAMSHELRTPLNAILGFSEIIRSQAFGPDAVDKYVEYANDVHVSGVHLLDLINDLLDVSKIEAGKMELSPEWLALPALLEASLRLVRVRAEQHNVTLGLDLPERVPNLYADERAVKQIVFNLLSNAVKFTPEGGRVTVDVTDTMDNGIQIRVTDTGIGIPQDQIERAFRPFEQIHPAASWAVGGTGLGLALVKGLVEQHGGTVHIDSKVNAGTTVTVRFPPGPAAVAYARTGAA
jgi:two-component system cell cycle sensor histidine kinase PleC